ncbi:hypothetical protein AKJ62_02210 [candidate division MSBL1 archaeon SCGC-AAA259D14]|uniref:ADC n=2 Tax=candidate division MSBL1 TaxID=215777 RepID=A0A133U6R2_9EURY|nr:hypothetical protein AKJ62_02210 [candidate division MSBL1 archaeon SCGC-AAA259D14]KXA92920.1 hypothetical protein AKJ66_03195 [candidate division MSBL1 archaeon SCGC-AAA259E22]
MEELLNTVLNLRERDWEYKSGKVFSSMCSNPLEEAWIGYQLFRDTNALDSDIFPSVKILEEKVIEEIGELFAHPEAHGYVGSGGTEGNIFALWLGRKLFEGDKVVAPSSVHYSVDKACDLQRLELIKTKLDENYRADVESIKEKVDRETSSIVVTAGTTATGVIDPIEEVAEVAEDYDCFLHVDASFGGFVLPFLEKVPTWNFEVDRVCSIVADPDKMGLVPIPSGVVLVREEKWLDRINIDAPYLSEVEPTLLGTRPGGAVASIWVALKHLGFEGYRRKVEKCMNLTDRLAKGIEAIDRLKLLVEPELNVVSFTSNFISPSEIYQDLKEEGWLVSLNTQPESIRLVVMPHHEPKHVKSFLESLQKYMEGR